MKTSTVVGLAAAVALCGCHRNSANDRGANAGAANDTGGTPVRLVGCLVPGGAGEPGFTLIDITSTAAAGTAGTTGTSASVDTGTPRSYALLGARKQDDLQKYQNSKVEVSGVLVASTDTGAGVPDVGAASAPAGTPPTAVQRVRVDHVKQLDKTCSSANQNPNR